MCRSMMIGLLEREDQRQRGVLWGGGVMVVVVLRVRVWMRVWVRVWMFWREEGRGGGAGGGGAGGGGGVWDGYVGGGGRDKGRETVDQE